MRKGSEALAITEALLVAHVTKLTKDLEQAKESYIAYVALINTELLYFKKELRFVKNE